MGFAALNPSYRYYRYSLDRRYFDRRAANIMKYGGVAGVRASSAPDRATHRL